MITIREILALSCKVLGLGYLVSGVSIIPQLIAELVAKPSQDDSCYFWFNPGVFFMPVVLVVSAFLLLKYSENISAFLVREDKSIQINLGENWQGSLYTLCLRVVGVVVIVGGIPDLFEQIPTILRTHRFGLSISTEVWGKVIASVVYIALGVHLMGGGQLIVKLTEKVSLKGADSDKDGP